MVSWSQKGWCTDMNWLEPAIVLLYEWYQWLFTDNRLLKKLFCRKRR